MLIALLNISKRWDLLQSLRATPFAVAMQRQSTAENWYRIYTPILTLPQSF